MIGGFFRGIQTYFQGFEVLSRYRLWRFALIPGLISLVLGIIVFTILGYVGGNLVDALFGGICNLYPESWPLHDGLCGVVEWLADSKLGEILSFLFSLIINVFIFRYIVMIVASPFMSTLTEQVEHKIAGIPAPKVGLDQMLKDIARGLKIALRNIFRELFWLLILSLIGLLIPFIGIFVTVGIFLMQSFYAGFGNLDYTLERKQMGVRDSVSYARHNRGLATGNGVIFMLLVPIPVLGWFLAPPLGAVAATLAYLKAEKKI